MALPRLLVLSFLLWPSTSSAQHCEGELEETVLLQHKAVQNCRRSNKRLTALLVIGRELNPDNLLFADRVFKDRLELWGYIVTTVKDVDVNVPDGLQCEDYDAILVSSSINGGKVGDRLDKCTTPMVHWESGLWNTNGMSCCTEKDGYEGNTFQNEVFVTNRYWHEHSQDGWLTRGYGPPAPTGPNIIITEIGEKTTLAAGFPSGALPFFMVDDYDVMEYGFNWVNADKLGSGAKVVAIIPPNTSAHWRSEYRPQVEKAVLFYYEKGSELWSGFGPSPNLRIGFPAYGFDYSSEPSCYEIANSWPCAACVGKCQEVEYWEKQPANPMPLSFQGLKMLDATITMLIKEAQKGNCKGLMP